MDSYSQYTYICRNHSLNSVSGGTHAFDGLANLIYKECLSSERNCTFLNKTSEFLRCYQYGKSCPDAIINLVDARALLEAAYMNSIHQGYTAGSDPNMEKYIGAIFRGKRFRKDENLRISEIWQYINLLNKLASKPLLNATFAGASSDDVHSHPVAVEANQPECEVVSSKEGTTSSATSEQATSTIEQEITNCTKERIEQRQQSLESWHEHCAQLNESVLALQSDMSGLLNRFIGFSDSVTANYVLRFANNLLELYNLVYDGFSYHNPRRLASTDTDYFNSVENYQVYMDVISDALADFGIEEIRSSPGDGFDGHLHEVRNTSNYMPRTATIQNSVRPGFRYGEIVIQKEWVEV